MKKALIMNRNTQYNGGQDFFETQDSTIDILYNHYLKKMFDKTNGGVIYDFSCGKGAILKRLKELDPKRLEIFGSDIINRNSNYCDKELDMFDLNKETETNEDGLFTDKLFDERAISKSYIVMNPPFNKLEKTMEYYIKLRQQYSKNIAGLCLLHSVRSLEGQRRHRIMDKFGYPSLILNMTKRQTFNTYFNENQLTWQPPFSVCWSIWDDDYIGHTKFKYVMD